jgi:hypothetical protein
MAYSFVMNSALTMPRRRAFRFTAGRLAWPTLCPQARRPDAIYEPVWVSAHCDPLLEEPRLRIAAISDTSALATNAAVLPDGWTEATLASCRRYDRDNRPTLAGSCRRSRSASPPSELRFLEARVAACTGLVLDPYFSASKIAWLLDHVPVVTVIWQYTGLSTPEMEQRVTTYNQYSISANVNGIRNMEAQNLNGLSVQNIRS